MVGVVISEFTSRFRDEHLETQVELTPLGPSFSLNECHSINVIIRPGKTPGLIDSCYPIIIAAESRVLMFLFGGLFVLYLRLNNSSYSSKNLKLPISFFFFPVCNFLHDWICIFLFFLGYVGFFFSNTIKFQSVLVLSDAEPCWFVSVTQSEADLEPEHQLNEIKYLPGLKTSGALGTEERGGEEALNYSALSV